MKFEYHIKMCIFHKHNYDTIRNKPNFIIQIKILVMFVFFINRTHRWSFIKMIVNKITHCHFLISIGLNIDNKNSEVKNALKPIQKIVRSPYTFCLPTSAGVREIKFLTHFWRILVVNEAWLFLMMEYNFHKSDKE